MQNAALPHKMLAGDPFSQLRSKTPSRVTSENHDERKPGEPIPLVFSAFRWQPVPGTKKMTFIAERLSTGLLWIPWRVVSDMLSNQRRHFSRRSVLICHLLPAMPHPEKSSAGYILTISGKTGGECFTRYKTRLPCLLPGIA